MIDKRLLDETVTVELKDVENTDVYGKTPYKQPLTLKFCRLDHSSGDNGTGNNRTRNKLSVLIFYPRYTPATVTDEWIDARVTDSDGNTYTVERWLSNKLHGRVFSYELELK